MRIWFIALLLIGSLFIQVTPVQGSTYTIISSRCHALTNRINLYRPDLRYMYLLCRVGYSRSLQQARAGRIWHDLRPVMAALSAARIRWCNVGEVIAWNNYSGTAATFVNQWHHSSAHWTILMARRYDHGGGAWVNYGTRHYATYYVLDTC